METFEWIILLLFGGALLSTLARRLGVPYPTLLAIGGACLALLPNSPGWTLDPHLSLTLFVAPVLLDAAYDSSPRDLRANWRAVGSLAVFAVGITTIAVAFVARWIVPDMPWPVAIALGAVVAPPDAAAASAIVRQLKLPHNILTILEGESLVNDASALLVYRLAVIAAISGDVSAATIVPAFLLVVIGSIAAGAVLGWIVQKINVFFDDVPTALILQFVTTFGVWMGAEAIGLSGILTIVTYAIVLARLGRVDMAASRRVRVNAVWETVVFVLNIFAFVLIGMQLQPIWQRLDGQRFDYVVTALAVLATAIAARFVWVMIFTGTRIVRGVPVTPRNRLSAAASLRGSLVISWAGMRGIVTLATAFALPTTLADGSPFPYRDLILLCAFTVVFGTLVLQGLTLRPLIAAMHFRTDGDVVENEVRRARSAAYQAALDAIDGDDSEEAERLRRDYSAAIELVSTDGADAGLEDMPGNDVRRRAVAAARERANRLRLDGEIGDEAYRVLESEFDWAELSAGAAD